MGNSKQEIKVERGNMVTGVRTQYDKVSRDEDNKADMRGDNETNTGWHDKKSIERDNKEGTEPDNNRVNNLKWDIKKVVAPAAKFYKEQDDNGVDDSRWENKTVAKPIADACTRAKRLSYRAFYFNCAF